MAEAEKAFYLEPKGIVVLPLNKRMDKEAETGRGRGKLRTEEMQRKWGRPRRYWRLRGRVESMGHMICFCVVWSITRRPQFTSSPVANQLCDIQLACRSCASCLKFSTGRELHWLRGPGFGSYSIWEWAMLRQDAGDAMLRLGQGGGKALEFRLSAGAISDLQGVEEDCGAHTSMEAPEHVF